MKDNRIIRVLRALRDHAIGKTETYWNGLNARQRKRIVYGLLALFFRDRRMLHRQRRMRRRELCRFRKHRTLNR